MSPHTKTTQQADSAFKEHCDQYPELIPYPETISFLSEVFQKFYYPKDSQEDSHFKNLLDDFKNSNSLTKFNELIEPIGIKVGSISSMLRRINNDKLGALQGVLQQLLLDVEKLETLKTLGIKFSNLSGILNGAVKDVPELLEELLKAIDKHKATLETLKKLEISFSNISSMLSGAGKNAPNAFDKLLTEINKQHKATLETLKKLEISFSNISSILHYAGKNAPDAFDKLLTTIDKHKATLETLKKLEIPFSNISSILHNAGKNAPDAFDKLLTTIDKHKATLETLKKLEIPFSNISSMLSGAGKNAPNAFDKLLTEINKHKATLKKLKIPFSNISSILHNAGKNAPDAFDKLLTEIDDNKEILRTLHPDVIKKLRKEGKYISKAFEKLLKQNPEVLTEIDNTASDDSIQELQVDQVTNENAAIQSEEQMQLDQQEPFNDENLATSSDLVSDKYNDQIALENNPFNNHDTWQLLNDINMLQPGDLNTLQSDEIEEVLTEIDNTASDDSIKDPQTEAEIKKDRGVKRKLDQSEDFCVQKYYLTEIDCTASYGSIKERQVANKSAAIQSETSNNLIVSWVFEEISGDPIDNIIYKDRRVKRKLDQSEDIYVQKHHCDYDNLLSNTLEDPEITGVSNNTDMS